MRHAHEVGIPEQSVAHIEMRFEISDAVDRIKGRTPRNGLPQNAFKSTFRISVARTGLSFAKQYLALRRPKQHTHEEVGMHDGIVAGGQVGQLAAAVSLTCKQC